MARLVVLGALLSALVAPPAHAEDGEEAPIPAETLVTAIRVGLDARALHGAVVTTRAAGAVAYLQAEGIIPRPQPLVSAAAEPPRGIWDALAACESTSRWNVSTGNGYYGGLQADMTFWRRYGGLAFAPRPDMASRAQQILVAQRGQAVQGWGAWPVCSRRLGLR